VRREARNHGPDGTDSAARAWYLELAGRCDAVRKDSPLGGEGLGDVQADRGAGSTCPARVCTDPDASTDVPSHWTQNGLHLADRLGDGLAGAAALAVTRTSGGVNRARWFLGLPCGP
jgi:hypothetical protein